MIPKRASGILLHITSLPGECPVGDLGAGSRDFVDFLVRSKQSCWQLLPLGPTIHGNSPYSCFSAFAGNPLLINISELEKDGLLNNSQVAELQAAGPVKDAARCDFSRAKELKQRALGWAFSTFQAGRSAAQLAEFESFCVAQSAWLDDYALFSALMRDFNTDNWTAWGPELAGREPAALESWRERLRVELEFEQFVQFLFYDQWSSLRRYALSRGIYLFGDMPIFLAHGSADVWSHQELFHLDASGYPTVVAGVPPDYFSKSGQLWGNPLYDWERLKADGYAWWIRRLAWAFESFDLLRIDHFRGFQAYWEVPADAKTAVSGKWVDGPGGAPFRAAQENLGELAIVAEDLGLITDEVHALRQELGFPGMRVLQFGFDYDHDIYHRPDEYPEQCVAYTGTHDNQTVLAWYESRSKDAAFRQRIAEYLGRADASQPLQWKLIAPVLQSKAQLTVIPLQDVLGLRDEARMNEPGEAEGNWTWRCTADQLSEALATQLCKLTEESGRS